MSPPAASPEGPDPLISDFVINGAVTAFKDVLGKVADLGQAALTEFDRAVPANWDHLTIPAAERLCRLMIANECNLAWVPRADLVEAVMHRPLGVTPMDVLMHHQEDVIDDLRDALVHVDMPEIEYRVKVARQAIDNLADGRPESAQATAGPILTGVAHDLARQVPLRKVYASLRKISLEEATILDLRRRTVRRLVGDAMQSADPRGPNPYRRSLSAHDVTPVQYTRENSMAALLLMVGALCELREEILAPELAAVRRSSMGLPIE